jgi:hypothetical protein
MGTYCPGDASSGYPLLQVPKWSVSKFLEKNSAFLKTLNLYTAKVIKQKVHFACREI